MAQIMRIDDFVKEYIKKLDANYMGELMAMQPGESKVIAFGATRLEDVVFVRVTKYHMATMSVYEFNGVR